jgi:Fe-S cluster biosynthesis and repair protein YggX
LGNKFLVTEDLNNFKIIFTGNNCYLDFQTAWDQWQEKIIKLNENKLILEHQEKRYHYKKFNQEH